MYGARWLIQKFLDKNLKQREIENLLRKLQEAGSFDHHMGSGRPRSSRSGDNISVVEELAQSQESKEQQFIFEIESSSWI